MCALSSLFLFINNFAEKLTDIEPERVKRLAISLFAEDFTILAADRSCELAAADAQWAVGVVEDWNKDWKLDLNASKSEVAFFSP